MSEDNSSSSSTNAFSRRDLLGIAATTVAGVGLGGFAQPHSAAVSTTAAVNATAQETSRLPLKILLRSGISPENTKQIEAVSPQITLVRARGNEEMQRALPDADVLFGDVSAQDLRLAKKLRWVQYGAAGVEGMLFPEMVNSPVILTNAQGCYAPEIAEHVFGLLFGLTRGIAQQIRQMREKQWGGGSDLVELRGMTMGIVGFGGIGRETARRAKAMDMRVIAADIQPMYREQLGNLVDEIHLVDGGGLARLLQESNVVVAAAPHTRRSEGMLGDKEFGLMKPGAYFINIARGKLVQTPALVKALTDKRLAGAGLDVTDPEPLPPDHSLWEMPNVIITSHTAGRSQFAGPRVQTVFVENVRRFALGLPLLNVVDKQAGF